MSINRPRPLPELLADQENPSLSGILHHCRQLHGLNALLGEILGAELAAHCHLANIRDNTLVLAADSAAWATRCRYLAPQLLQKIRSNRDLSGIDNIRVKITTPPSPADTSHSIRRAYMSETTSECINQCAESIDDPHLSSALRQLAKRKRPGS
jgi:hypothetical protein